MAIPIILRVYDGGKLKLARAFRSERIRLGSGAVDLVLEGEGVALHHAVIESGAGGAVIRALSPAPLYVNGQAVLAAPLRHGDLLTLGQVRVMVELRTVAPSASALGPAGAHARPHLQVIHNPNGPDVGHGPHSVPSLAVVRDGKPESRGDSGLARQADGLQLIEAALPTDPPQSIDPPRTPATPLQLTKVEQPTWRASPEAPPAQPVNVELVQGDAPVGSAPARGPAAPPSSSAATQGPPAQPSSPVQPAQLASSPVQPAQLASSPAQPGLPARAHARASLGTPTPFAAEGDASSAEVEMFWGETRVAVWHLAPGEELNVGTGAGCQAVFAGIDRAAVVRSDLSGWVICAPRPLALTLLEAGQAIGGAELLVRGRGQADATGISLPLPSGAEGVISSGSLSLRVRRVRLVARAPAEVQDWKGPIIATCAALLLLGLMKVISVAVPPPSAQLTIAEVITPRPALVRAAAKPTDPEAPPKSKAQGRRDPGRAVARHENTEGEAGSTTAPRRQARAERKTDDRAAVAQAGLLKALGGGKGQSDLFGVALERGTRDALGHLAGPRVADARGEGGMGLRSLGGTGGGGDGSGLGLARIGTNGIGGGSASYGEGRGGLKGKSDAEIGLGPGQPQVIGHIDPELIRKVVHDHRAQIRNCYEIQLNARPGLAGKVISAWTINALGDVTEAHTAETMLQDRAVEECVVAKIKTWHFPLPKGGGEVFVTYPFIFTPGG